MSLGRIDGSRGFFRRGVLLRGWCTSGIFVNWATGENGVLGMILNIRGKYNTCI